MKYKKAILRILGFLGFFIFIPLFVLTFANPHSIEKYSANFIEWQLKTELNKKVDSINLANNKKNNLKEILIKKSKNINLSINKEIEKTKENIKKNVHLILLEELSKIKKLNCECRKNWENKLKNTEINILKSLEENKEKIRNFTNAKYMEIVNKLIVDLRIFFGINAIIFLLLLFLSFVKPKAINHLILPSILIFSSTLICSYFYIFEQNWLYTIIYNNYTGFTFLAYLFFIFCLLCDITLNKCRITTEIINGIFHTIGSMANLVPC